MTTPLVIDASVYVADARPSEAHHAEAHALLSAAASVGAPVLMPAITLPEIASAIARGTGKADLARSAVDLYRQWPSARLIAVDSALADVAALLGARHRLRGCDAVYAALAMASSAVLVSLDRQQLDRCPDAVHALSPGEAVAHVSGA